MEATQLLRDLASAQHGVVSRAQARSLGISRSALANEMHRCWTVVTPRVLRLTGAPPTFRQRAHAAVLDGGAGAVLSHHSAAALWEIPGYRLDDMHITRPRGGTRRPVRLAIVHEPILVPAGHVTISEDGIPVTTPARTVFDLAAVVHPYRLERTLDNAWSRRLLNGVQIARVLDDLAKRGRGGTVAVRELLKSRGPEYVPPDSGLEGRFQEVLRRGGLPSMRRQVDVGSDHWIGRVDFVDHDLPLVVQIDSSRFHGSLLDQERDAAQTAELLAGGFEVVRLTDFEVWYEADLVAEKVRATRSRVRNARSNGRSARKND
jgi:very-short-patch-repair endonuclease